MIERTFKAPISDVWELWTTKDGIESWWGPEGFGVTVSKIDLRVGGELLYSMNALAPEMVEFMKKNGMPTSTHHRMAFQEVVKNKRLAFTSMADFIPGVTPYELATSVDMEEHGNEVRLLLTIDPMHDDVWTGRQKMGWESELGKLAKVLESK